MNAPQKPATKRVINESGIEVRPLYTAQDVEASGGMEMVGEPGQCASTLASAIRPRPTNASST